MTTATPHARDVSTTGQTVPDTRTIKRAILSVYDKRGIVELAQALHNAGVSILSTGGTARAITDAGIPVTSVSDATGADEMLDGRVKTLHPTIHGAILADRSNPEHTRALADRGIEPIDLVCVNLYPFERTVAEPGVTHEGAIEEIDIGGPTMIRAAAKNHSGVTVLTSPAMYDRLTEELREHNGATTDAFRRECAREAFAHTAAYDAAISAYFRRDEKELPGSLTIRGDKADDLRYGENPHQRAAVYRDPFDPGTSIIRARQLHGKSLSYNNVSDADRALRIVQDFRAAFPDKHGATVIKHTNPCGAAIAPNAASAIGAALQGDPLAAYGGILCANTPITEAAADVILESARFLEVIAAPAFEAGAAERLGEKWANVRLLELGEIAAPAPALDFRPVRGGMLVQDQDTARADIDAWQRTAGPEVPTERLNCAAFVWITTKHLTSNAIALGTIDPEREGTCFLVGSGAGQMDRVASCRIALAKASSNHEHDLVAASDAFFPFSDGPELLIGGGATILVHPGGSKRDHETIELCNECGVTLFATGVRHFRH